MILLIETLKKAARPGLLGAKGAKIERACAKDLRAYFKSLRGPVSELAQFASYGKDAAIMAVDLKVHNLLRQKRELLTSILETNIEAAFLAALKQDVVHEQAVADKQRKKYGIAEAEFREWPDSSGEDDHGREPGIAKVKDGIVQPESLDDLAKRAPLASATKEGIRHDIVHGVDKQLPEATKRFQRQGTHFYTDTKTGKKVMGGYFMGWAEQDSPKNYDKLGLADKAKDELKQQQKWGYRHNFDFHVAAKSPSFKEADGDPIGLAVKDKVGPTGQDAAKYAKEKAAGLVVGIDDTTRKQIRDAVSTGIEDQLGVPGTSRLIRDLLDVWDTSRADTIASTEMNDSMSEAQYRKMQALAVPYKQIILSDDACEICQDNADVDPLPIDEPYPSGDLRAPFHPNCRCATTGSRPPGFDDAEEPSAA